MFEGRKVLVVEDDKSEMAIIERHLRDLKASYKVASSVVEAQSLMESEDFEFILSDLHIHTRAGTDRPDGLDVISLARQHHPSAVVVATSSDPRSDVWNEALKAGAQNFIRKPLSKSDELVIAFGLAFERKLFKAKNGAKAQPSGRWAKFADQYPDGIVLDKVIQKRAMGMTRHPDKPCVIMGETGTGKEEIAKLIHRHRCSAEGEIPLVAVNCATITHGLTESLLFGHKRGAFTGAETSTVGYIGEANRGILFLDEIQTLDLVTQQKLLRVLNDGTYNRLGETKTLHSQFQLVAASTKDLDEEVEEGKFLLDLRTRMIGLDINLKPLRERKEDIPALVALFLSKRSIALSDEDYLNLVKHLQTLRWRGNIRQLFKTLDAWVLTSELDEVPLKVANFPILRESVSASSAANQEPGHFDKKFESFRQALMEDHHLENTVNSYEKAVIELALERHHYKIGSVCNALQIPRSSLDGKRRKYGLMA